VDDLIYITCNTAKIRGEFAPYKGVDQNTLL